MTQDLQHPVPGAPEARARTEGRPAFGSGLASGIFLLTVMGILWGSTIALSKIAVAEGAHPLGLTFWQGAIGGTFLLTVSLLRRRPPRLERRFLTFYAVCGILGSVIPASLLFWVAIYLSAGVISIAIACVPLMTYLLATLLGIEPPGVRRLAGVGLGLASVALITLPETSLPEAGLAIWVVIAVASCACYAMEDIYISLRRPAGLDALALTAGMLLVAALIMVPIILATDAWVPITLPFGPLEWSVIAMALASAVAYSMFLYVISVAGPIFASQTAYLVTLAGVLWGMALLGERHSFWIWAALAVMLAGLLLVQPRSRGTA
jgi:drug/metabolite transporter (DMT)-like permease